MKSRFLVCVLCLLVIASLAGCSRSAPQQAPAAAASVSLERTRVPLGSPVEMKYKFVVPAQAPKIDGDYRVFVHFLDGAREMMWADDHIPSVPTSQWKPGQRIEYTRSMFVPVYPYVGQATVEIGLYREGKRLALTAGTDKGHQSYEVATFELLPQTENVFLIYKDGWYPTEVAPDSPTTEWQWTRKEATLSFRNPRQNVVFHLHLDKPQAAVAPQTVTVRVGDQVVDTFSPTEETIRKIPISAAQLGNAEMTELRIAADKTFTPALLPASNSRDTRELGLRIFHTFIEPK